PRPRRHSAFSRDWPSDVCSSDLSPPIASHPPPVSPPGAPPARHLRPAPTARRSPDVSPPGAPQARATFAPTPTAGHLQLGGAAGPPHSVILKGCTRDPNDPTHDPQHCHYCTRRPRQRSEEHTSELQSRENIL